MAKVFVWLRYSASRQLTWQRNYNTQPRILGEAQARLTSAIAQARCCQIPPPDSSLMHAQLRIFAWLRAARRSVRHAVCHVESSQKGVWGGVFLAEARLACALRHTRRPAERRRSGCGPCWALWAEAATLRQAFCCICRDTSPSPDLGGPEPLAY